MLPNLWGEYTEEDLYQIAISRPLEEKIESAIALIQTYEGQALQLSPDGYYVAFSGGKDSIVMAKLFEMAGVKYTLNYSNVTIDPPELVQFLKREYPQAIWHSRGKPLPLECANQRNVPTRTNRWCCEVYKENGGNGLFKSIGVRAAESARRKGLWKSVTTHNKTKLPVLCPILYWTDTDVWAFIHDNNMPYCELYDQGFTRLGCIGCPLGGPKQQALEFARWPKYEKLWRRGFDVYWANWKGVPKIRGGDRWIEKFENVDQLWNWWVSGKAYEGEGADCQMWLW